MVSRGCSRRAVQRKGGLISFHNPEAPIRPTKPLPRLPYDASLRFHTKYIHFSCICTSTGVRLTGLSAMKSTNNNNIYKMEKKKKQGMDGERFDLAKAAAWAWYERAHRNESTAVKACNPRLLARKPWPSVYRPSRFMTEASAETKRGGGDPYNNNKSKSRSFDISRLSRSARTDFADETEYLNRSVRNLDAKCSRRWDFGKSLLDSYEIVAIFKHVDNYAPFKASLPRGSEDSAGPEAAHDNTNLSAKAGENENLNGNRESTVGDLCLPPSGDGRSMCSPTSEIAGVLEIGTAQKQRYLRTVFSLNALSEKLKSLAHLRFVRFHHRDGKQHRHRQGHRHPKRGQDVNH